MEPAASTTVQTATTFSLRPLMFGSFACTMAIMAFVALAGPVARTLSLEPWHVGAAISVSGVAWSATARRWGRLSDQRGRRSVLLTGVAGFAVAYLVLCGFIDFALRTTLPVGLAFAGLLLGRTLVGIFYAAMPATGAALVADHVAPDQRAGALAALGAASGVGMVLGPGFVGLFSPLGLSLPLFVTALLPICAYLVLWSFLPRTEQHNTRPMSPPRPNDPRLRRPMLVAFLASFSIATAQVTVGFFALDRLEIEPAAAAQVAGIALTVVGVSLVLSQGLLRKLGWPPLRLIRIGTTVAAVGFAATTLATTAWGLWLALGLAALGMGWVNPSVSALAANSVEDHEQGVAAGTITAMQGLGSIVGPAVGTLVYAISEGAPYLMVAALFLVAGFLVRNTKPA